MLHLVCFIAENACVIPGHSQGSFPSVDRLIGLLGIEYESGEWIWFAVFEPVNEEKQKDVPVRIMISRNCHYLSITRFP